MAAHRTDVEVDLGLDQAQVSSYEFAAIAAVIGSPLGPLRTP